eukprot:TRINITY_DN8538_c0_g1_i1.p1 TRINITY_DN8538_c0_g1~~TRINITY_DN8538_c0_g1_i1.p1  ORF type:complete len:265 (-),score=14.62 TRINITY_DN8538_c0_g1_i1:83-877(-)
MSTNNSYPKTKKVLLIGQSRSGKSSFQNSIGVSKCGWNQGLIPCGGNSNTRGTRTYNRVRFTTNSVNIDFYDTAGKSIPPDQPLSDTDRNYVHKLLDGLDLGIDLTENQWQVTNTNSEHKIDNVLIFIDATDSRQTKSIMVSSAKTESSGGILGLFGKKNHVPAKYEDRSFITECVYGIALRQLYDCVEKYTKVSPFIIVTKRDILSQQEQKELQTALCRIVPTSMVFFVENWTPEKQSFKDGQVLDDIISRIHGSQLSFDMTF